MLEEECSGCKSCIPLCPYTRHHVRRGEEKAAINEALCKGCGTCVASCPSGSIAQNLFEDEEIFSEIEGVLAYELTEWKPRIVAFFCNWCTYTAADLAGVSRLKYAANIRVIRLMCSGRVDPQFILDALPGARTACSSAAAIPATATTSRATTRCSAASGC